MIQIGPIHVDLSRRELILDGQPVHVGSRAFDILAVLIAAQGALVSKNDLLAQVWPDTIVEENNLQVHMSALRKVLGESRNLIQTVSGRGYRLVYKDPSVAEPSATSAYANVSAALARSCAAASVPNNLPANSSPLIGRAQALGDIALALTSTRHITLVGSGGIGKTRLAIEVARHVMTRFPDGVYLVPLASAVDTSGVLTALATSLGVTASGPLTLAHVSKELGARSLLIVLDNCEHVLGPAAILAEMLLNLNAAVRVLATSREPLRVIGENLYWMASLDVPVQNVASADILQSSAVQLFLSRARALDARFSSDDRSIQLTGTVCRRLDGIPLAIELAAARAAILGIETLAAHLDDRFNMLTGGNRTALPRHQTLKATLDWSHALLADAERATLRRLGVFVSSFTIDSAVAIVSADGLKEAAIIDALSGLVEKSLVVMEAAQGDVSYRLLETTRAYALQKLDDNGERRLATLNHARYFAKLLEHDASREPGNAAQSASQWPQRMRASLDDVRASLAWALSSKGDAPLGETLAVRTVALLYELSLVDECCAWARRALDSLAGTHQGARTPHHLRVRLQLLAALGAALVYVNGPNRETLAIWAEVLALSIGQGDRAFEARALWGMWNASQSSGAARDALVFARRFGALAAESNNPANTVLASRLLGIASHYVGDQRVAREALERFLQHSASLQHGLPLGQSIDQGVVGRATLARLLGLQGARDQALELAAQCVADACRQQQAIVTCYVLIEAEIPLALLAGQRARAAESIALLQEVSARAGLNVAQACCRCFDEYLHSLDNISLQRVHTFRTALDDLDALDYAAPRAFFDAQYSLALGRAGQHEEGIAAVTAALSRCDETGDRWYVVELRRVHAELLLMGYGGDAGGDAPFGAAATSAQACLSTALEESAAQGCGTLHLRAATSLARLRLAQGLSEEAVQLIEPARSAMKEGLDWDDYAAASAVLDRAAAACASALIRQSETDPLDDATRASACAAPPADEIGERC